MATRSVERLSVLVSTDASASAAVSSGRARSGPLASFVDEVDDDDEELAAFLAADYEPVEADPEFKRKLRDQLWSLIQSNEMTRQ